MKTFPAVLLASTLLFGGAGPLLAQTLRPDLQASLFDLAPKEAKPGQRIEVTDETRNVGGREAASTVFEFWLGPRSDTTTGAIRLTPGTKNVKPLLRTETYPRATGSRYLTIPANATNRGPQFILGIVRPVTGETNLNNNTNSVPITILPL